MKTQINTCTYFIDSSFKVGGKSSFPQSCHSEQLWQGKPSRLLCCSCSWRSGWQSWRQCYTVQHLLDQWQLHFTSKMSFCKVGNQTSSQDPQAVNSRIFVGNLNTFQVNKIDVEKVFQRYGRIVGKIFIIIKGFQRLITAFLFRHLHAQGLCFCSVCQPF